MSLDRLNSNHSLGAYTESFIARSDNPSMIRRAIDRRGMKQLLGGTVACLLLAFSLLFHAWMRTQVTQEGYRLSRLSTEHQKLLRTREELTLQSARLRSPARIEMLAREQLKMGPPSTAQVIVLANEKAPVQPLPALLPASSAVARR